MSLSWIQTFKNNLQSFFVLFHYFLLKIMMFTQSCYQLKAFTHWILLFCDNNLHEKIFFKLLFIKQIISNSWTPSVQRPLKGFHWTLMYLICL